MHLAKRIVLFFLFLTSIGVLSAQQINEMAIYSPKMKREVENTIILPKNYGETANVQYPVIYLLNGHGGNNKSFLLIKPNLSELADSLNIIFVCPAGYNSWYWDSPIDPKLQFETYVSKELIAYIDSAYSTIPRKEGRAITGFSMGGHGALWVALNHPDVFGAAGSMSGGVDIRPFPLSWDMQKSLGSYKENRARWDQHTIANNVDRLRLLSPALIIDCGQDDFFIEVNEALHRALFDRKIIHTYIVTPGEHNADYWRKAMDWQLKFFSEYFSSSK